MSSSSHPKHQSSRGESSKNYKYSSNKDSKHKKHSSSKSNAPSSGRSSNNSPRFLFVVNEVTLDPNFDQPYAVDSWLNAIPPTSAEAYGRECVGEVFQYDGGHISLAADYSWYRPGLGRAGGIGRAGSNGYFYMVPYKTGTVFACSPHLPIIVSECDASCVPTCLYNPCECDPAAVYDDSGEALEPSRWNLLSFFKENGLSLVNSTAGDSPYVAGRNPSWIPALVPKVFENVDGGAAPPSLGLGGDLPTIIGLMAFHSRRGRASEVFSEGRWQQNQWQGGPRAPSGYPNSQHPSPRGFVVHIAMNVRNEGLSEDDIDEMKREFANYEWNNVFVRG